MPTTPRRAVAAIFIAFGVVLSIAACDSGGLGGALPTAPPDAGSSTAPGPSGAVGPDGSPLPSGAIADPMVAWPAFAACMRDHGLEIPDPEVDANGDPHWTDDFKRLITEEVRTACNPIISAITETGGSGRRTPRSYSFESLVANAQCMREHGLPDYPDPIPDQFNQGLADGYDKGNATVLSALIACEGVLVETTPSASPEQ